MSDKKPEHIWIAWCGDIFGGYGLRAVGRTKRQCMTAFMRKYREISPPWNKEKKPAAPSFKTVDEEWGVWLLRYKVGEAYFGDHDETAPKGRTPCQME